MNDRSISKEWRYLHQMADAIEAVFWLADANEPRILYISPAYERIWGRDRQRLYTNYEEFFASIHPDDRKRVQAASSQCVAQERFEVEYRIVRPDGEVRWVRDRGFLIRQTGAPDRLAGFAEDITAAKQTEQTLRQSEAQLRAVAANLPNGAVFIVDRELRYQLAEGAAIKLAGMTSKDLVGKTLWEALDPALAAEYEPFFRQALRGKPYTVEHRSHERDFISHGTPLVNDRGEIYAVLAVSYDISDRKRVEEELARSRRQFEKIAETTPGLVYVYDLVENRNLYVNTGINRVLGYSPEQIAALGSSLIASLVHPDDIPGVLEGNQQFYRLGDTDVYDHELRMRHARGDYRWLRCRDAVFERAEDGTVTQIIGNAQDITAHKQAELALHQSESRFRLMVESAKDYAIFTLDLNGLVTSWNSGAERLLGYSEAEIIGCDGRIIFTPEDDAQGRPEREMQLALTQGRAENERWHVRQDGSRFWGSGLVTPLQDEAGTTQGFVKIMRDKTAQRQIEAEREHLLQQEQAAREEAERANRLKDEFLAVLSHELRSPLNPILGWSQLLQGGRLNEIQQKEALATIERNAQLQAQLIEDLLDISRIMQGKLTLVAAPVNLAVVISAAVDTVRLAAQAKHIEIALDLGEVAPLWGDAARLQQVVWNLLSNAVKFTPQGGQVTVELRQIDRLAQIRVIDTGKGIAPPFLPYVFEYFRQEDSSTTRQFGGLGLGLAIVRQIVEMHGGRVSAESQGENQGATFIVQLPVLQATATVSKPAQTHAETEAPLSHLQILVVDDVDDTREFQSVVLEQSGAQVTAVASALEALQVLDQFIPDVIVSDIGMAEMDGYMLIEQIRSRPPKQGGTIRAIALTAYVGATDQQQALQSGFQRYLSKPIEPERLIEAIIRLWNNA